MSFKKFNYQEKFEKLSLTNENVSEVEFEECDFNECSFINTKFGKCKFINCKFDECIVSAIGVTNSRFVNVSFSNSKIIGIDWTKTQHLQEISFEKCQINYSNFRLLKLPKIIIVSCEVREVDFIETDLSEGDFTNTDFEKSVFSKTNLTKADFRGAKNYYIDSKNNIIKKAHFSLPEALTLLDTLDIIID